MKRHSPVIAFPATMNMPVLLGGWIVHACGIVDAGICCGIRKTGLGIIAFRNRRTTTAGTWLSIEPIFASSCLPLSLLLDLLVKGLICLGLSCWLPKANKYFLTKWSKSSCRRTVGCLQLVKAVCKGKIPESKHERATTAINQRMQIYLYRFLNLF